MNNKLRQPVEEVENKHGMFSIFLVDDDESYLFALAFQLKKDTGWKVNCYTSVEDCLCFLNLEPGVIILDYHFENKGNGSIDGLTALKLIKSIKPRIPVIILSSQLDLDISVKLLKMGAYSYIVKDWHSFPIIEKTLFALKSEIPFQRKRRIIHRKNRNGFQQQNPI